MLSWPSRCVDDFLPGFSSVSELIRRRPQRVAIAQQGPCLKLNQGFIRRQVAIDLLESIALVDGPSGHVFFADSRSEPVFSEDAQCDDCRLILRPYGMFHGFAAAACYWMDWVVAPEPHPPSEFFGTASRGLLRGDAR